MKVQKQTGWAAVEDDRLILRTVSPEKRGAMVNWLYLNGYMITNTTPDAAITALFEHHEDRVRLEKVSVEVCA